MKKLLSLFFFLLFTTVFFCSASTAKAAEAAGAKEIHAIGFQTVSHGKNYSVFGDGSTVTALTLASNAFAETSTANGKTSVLLQSGTLALSYAIKKGTSLYDDPATSIGEHQLGASVRHGAILVEKKDAHGFRRVAVACDVFGEGKNCANFFSPSYVDIKEGATYRITVAYAVQVGGAVTRFTEVYSLSLLRESSGIRIREMLPDDVKEDLSAGLDPVTIEYLEAGISSLQDGSVTPYGFSLDLNGQTAAVSHNGKAFVQVKDGAVFEAIGRYTIVSDGNVQTVYVTPKKEGFFSVYYPQGVVNGERRLGLGSDIPVYEQGASVFALRVTDQTPPLQLSIESLDTGKSYTCGEPLTEAGVYLLSITDKPQREDILSGTVTAASYVFRISDDLYSENHILLLQSMDASAFYPLYIEVSFGEHRYLFSAESEERARRLALENAGSLSYGLFYDGISYCDYEWWDYLELERAKAESVLVLPGGFIFLEAEANKIRITSLQTGLTTFLRDGVPVENQLQESGYYAVSERQGESEERYTVLFLANRPQPISVKATDSSGEEIFLDNALNIAVETLITLEVDCFDSCGTVVCVQRYQDKTLLSSKYYTSEETILLDNIGEYRISFFVRGTGWHPQNYTVTVTASTTALRCYTTIMEILVVAMTGIGVTVALVCTIYKRHHRLKELKK